MEGGRGLLRMAGDSGGRRGMEWMEWMARMMSHDAILGGSEVHDINFG